jgi:hypothetical protein
VMRAAKPFKLRWTIEFALMLAVLAGFAHLVYNFHTLGYLPLPFVYDVSDTFMDWFNPAWYAYNGHAYDIYISIYAPLSFAILKVLGIASCYDSHPKDGRTCDYVGIASILAFYLLCVICAAIAFFRKDKSTALFRSIGFGIGMPLLYALERGNLIMVGILFFIIFFGSLSKSRAGLAASAAIMINMKSYLLFAVLALGIKRRWRLLELCGIATIGLYLVSLAYYGSGTPTELMNNLKVWFNAMDSVVWDQISYSTTYSPFLQFDAHQYPVRDFVPSRIVDAVTIFIKAEMVASRLAALVCLALAWLYPKQVPLYRLAFFLLMQSFVVDNPGGYGQSLIIFLVFLEKWDNPRIGIAIVMAYLISIPTDILFAKALDVERISWLGGRIVSTVYGLTAGALFRPLLILIMLWALVIDTLIEVHRAMKRERPQLALSSRPNSSEALPTAAPIPPAPISPSPS